MPRVSEIDSDRGDAILEPIFARERDVFGGPLNPTKVYAHRPPILKVLKDTAAALERGALIEPQLRSLLYLRVAILNGCPF